MPEQGVRRLPHDMVRRCHELDPTRAVHRGREWRIRNGHLSDASTSWASTTTSKAGQIAHEASEDADLSDPRRPARFPRAASTGRTSSQLGSSLRLKHTDWGELAEDWWKFYATRAWLAGGFAWTGFDYRGEPTPYGWPSINSQFGIVDMCGFPKDNFFYYKAWWGTEPSAALVSALELGGREGEPFPVWVIPIWKKSNCSSMARPGPRKLQPLTHLGVEGEIRTGRA